jgi:hypothetical protein
MNEHLRDRILRKLETLADDRGYQVLDYVEYLESKYAERQSPQANVFTRLTESVEDKLRAGRVSASVISETMGFLNRASNVLNTAMETVVGTARGADKPSASKDSTDKPNVDKPSADKPNIDKPNVDKPNVDKPNVDKPNVDKPSTDTPSVDKESASTDSAEQTSAGN